MTFYSEIMSCFCGNNFCTFFGDPLAFLILVGSFGGHGGSKMVSASTPSANEPAKDLILVHTVQLKIIDKSTFLRKDGT